MNLNFHKYCQTVKHFFSGVLRRENVSHHHGRWISAYWWTWQPNFGDLLTPYLLEKSGITPVLQPVSRAQFACVGSILEHLHSRFRGTVFGAGFIRPHSHVDLSHCQIRAVRGHLTRQRLGLSKTLPLGDPGLLLRHFFKEERQPKKYVLGLIPHFNDASKPQIQAICRREPDKIMLIDVTDIREGITPVLKQIDQCEYVISSSLHGLVVAEAFDIPTAWTVLSGKTGGLWYRGTYKYDDYYSVFGIDRQPITLAGEETLSQLIQKTVPPPSQLPEVADKLLSAWNETLESLLG